MYFRKKMVTAGNGTIYTNIITITVNPAFDPGTIGSDQSVCKTLLQLRLQLQFCLLANLIQNLWQISDNNASWTDITGSTNDYYDAGVLTVSKFFLKGKLVPVALVTRTALKSLLMMSLWREVGNDQSITYVNRLLL
ncbi:MAG: hypothetical protein IPJ16_00005 [Bacteroidales bacterium]|nr:hypothetical protein [Bacteroidales bacterium]